ncbi:hypothetical protein HLV37_02295 [Eggerthellaceae bacterium zg-1084]|uniref:hypothetical protein n=1 Tax=Berryella wangjianweii TaxID=2734634 RepID=UPI001555EE27|nr:hypothetical protein [Berryella wangjianweii]NPD30710.1 hypothetical protein [Berryella wangjianweii]
MLGSGSDALRGLMGAFGRTAQIARADRDDVADDRSSRRAVRRDLDGDLPRASAAEPRGDERRRSRRKKRASALFDRTIGAGERDAAPAEGAPRAAVYEGRMGAAARKTARLVPSASAGPVRARLNPAGLLSGLTLNASRAVSLTTVAALIGVTVFLYAPARDWYQALRENQRLELEYELVQERNAALKSQNDALRTGAGIETTAHERFGWVRRGESTAVVSGLSRDAEAAASPAEPPKSVRSDEVSMPSTWYSPLGDLVFGVTS